MPKELEVDVGGIPLDKLEEWAKQIPRFAEVTSDTNWLQKAYDTALKELKERGCPDELITRHITKELFNETICENLMVIFARASNQGYFEHKSEETIVNETLSNPEWLSEATEKGIGWFVNSAVDAFNECSLLNLIGQIACVCVMDDHEDDGGESDDGDQADNEGGDAECKCGCDGGCDGNCSTCYGDSYGCGAHHGDSSGCDGDCDGSCGCCGCDGCDDCDEQ